MSIKVREAEMVEIVIRVEPLDGQVAALIEKRHRI